MSNPEIKTLTNIVSSLSLELEEAKISGDSNIFRIVREKLLRARRMLQQLMEEEDRLNQNMTLR